MNESEMVIQIENISTFNLGGYNYNNVNIINFTYFIV